MTAPRETGAQHSGEASPERPPRLVRLGDLLVVLGVLAVVGFSFAPFVRYSEQALATLLTATGVASWFDAWSRQTFMMPLTGFVVLAAVLAAAATVTRFVVGRDLHLAGFRLRQLELGLTLFASVVLLGMVSSVEYALFGADRLATADPLFEPEQVALEAGWGAVLMLLGALLAFAGAVANHLDLPPVLRLGRGAEERTADVPSGDRTSGDQPHSDQSNDDAPTDDGTARD